MANNCCKNTKSYAKSYLTVLFLVFVNIVTVAQNVKPTNASAQQKNNTTKNNDSLPPTQRGNTRIPTQQEILRYDSLNKATKKRIADSIITTDTFKFAISKDTLDAPIKRLADDSAVYLVDKKIFILYGKAVTEYADSKINAHYISLDNDKQTLLAKGEKDSTGNISEQVSVKTGTQDIMADSILYSTKTGKAVSYNSSTQSEELYVHSEKIKLLGDKKSFFGYNNVFTTCNFSEPHFGFHTKKIKVINGELAVSNYAYPEFEGVPFPIGIPFGIYPLKRERHGGFLPPQFATDEQRGVGLEGLGYYLILGDYWDIIARTNVYSYGSWNVNISPTYRKRYKYTGGFSIDVQNFRSNFKGDIDFVQNRSFRVNWNHSSDTRARPGVSFGASVSAGTGGHSRFNNNNPQARIDNKLASTIRWAKTWEQSNLQLSLGHNQDINSGIVNLNFPEVTYALQTQYPFAKKEAIGIGKWYEKIGIAYTGNMRTQVSFSDKMNFNKIIQSIKDTLMWGIDHNIPITLALPSLGAVTVAPSVTYRERTYGLRILRTWNNTTKKVDTTLEKNIYQAREVGFGLSFATALYGTYLNKNKLSNLLGIRHVIRPTAGITYTPNTNARSYQKLQVDTQGTVRVVSVYERNLYQPFGNQAFGGVNFGLDQNLELKTRKRGDTTSEGTRKVSLIDGLSISSGYNLLADTLALSPFSFSLRSTVANGRLNITAGATLNPYKVKADGTGSNEYAWKGQKFGLQSFGTFTNFNISLSTQFKGGDKDKKKTKNGKTEYLSEGTTDMTLDQQMQMSNYINNNPSEFVDFSIPWDISIQSNVQLNNIVLPNYQVRKEITATLNVNGNFSLTPKWKLGGSAYYDARTNQINQMQLFITREMHCWQLAINVTPIAVGGFRSFNITINPKAGILRDLRVNRTRFFYN